MKINFMEACALIETTFANHERRSDHCRGVIRFCLNRVRETEGAIVADGINLKYRLYYYDNGGHDFFKRHLRQPLVDLHEIVRDGDKRMPTKEEVFMIEESDHFVLD